MDTTSYTSFLQIVHRRIPYDNNTATGEYTSYVLDLVSLIV